MSDISQTELLSENNASLQKKLHTCLPAKIVAFDNSTQTATIELMIQQMAYDGSMLELPPLIYVPVQMFSYGMFSIVAEPQEGDEGLAMFSERCIDGWWESSQKSVPLDVRFHDLSDAFFTGGYKSKPNALTIIPNAIHIGSAGAYVRIFANGTLEVKGATTFLDVVTAPDFITTSAVSLASHVHVGVKSGTEVSGVPQ